MRKFTIYDVEQQTEEWYKCRYGKIGGSSLKDVMANINKPIRGNAIYSKILSEHSEPFVFEDMPSTRDMEHGNIYEKEARIQFERITGKSVKEYGWLEKNPIHGISPDGIIGDFKEALEIKCPNAATYSKYIQDTSILIQDYAWQIVNYFSVLPISKLYVVAYRPMNNYKPILIIEVDRDSKIRYTASKEAHIEYLIKLSDCRIEELNSAIKEDIQTLSF